MNTPYKNSTNLQGNSKQNNQSSAALYPSMQSGFIPFEESTPKNRHKFQNNSRNNTPYNAIPYFSGNRQNQPSGGGSNWSQNRNNRKNFRQNNRNNNSLFTQTEDNPNVRDNKDGEGHFNTSQHQGNNDPGGSKNRFNNYQHNNRRNFFNNNRRGGGKGFGYGGEQNKHKDISEYVHTSMLEDPWKDLLERHNALNSGNLKIFDNKHTTEEFVNATSSASDNNNDSDNGDENNPKKNSDD